MLQTLPTLPRVATSRGSGQGVPAGGGAGWPGFEEVNMAEGRDLGEHQMPDWDAEGSAFSGLK